MDMANTMKRRMMIVIVMMMMMTKMVVRFIQSFASIFTMLIVNAAMVDFSSIYKPIEEEEEQKNPTFSTQNTQLFSAYEFSFPSLDLDVRAGLLRCGALVNTCVIKRLPAVMCCLGRRLRIENHFLCHADIIFSCLV